MRKILNFLVLLTLKVLVRLFYRVRLRWIPEEPPKPWGPYRVLAILNHTSLFDWMWIAVVPVRFVWTIASIGMAPIADKTLNRPFVGKCFKLIVPHPVSITRQTDQTWTTVLEKVDAETMVIILPEGRMKRLNGLDKSGRTMTVRGGIADILQVTGDGKMLLAYSQGLHHVQAPGQAFPKLFQTIRMDLEEVDIQTYKRDLGAETASGEFKTRVKRDLEARRDLHCTGAET